MHPAAREPAPALTGRVGLRDSSAVPARSPSTPPPAARGSAPRTAAFLACLAALSGACAPAPEPTWIALRGGVRATHAAAASDAPLQLEADGSAAWVEHALAPELWRPGARADTWTAVRPDGVGFMKSGEELTLSGAGASYANRPELDNPADLEKLAPGTFACVGELVHLCLAPGERPDRPLTFAVKKTRSHGERPALGAWTGDGFSLWPGESMTFSAAVPERCELRFYWCAEGLRGRAPTRAELRVTLDGAPLEDFASEVDARGQGRWCRVALPAGGRARAALAFELAGEPSLAAVLAPRIGPLRAGTDAAGARRAPDLILFLADTFRADNLACAGGAPALAPELDRLAERSLRFTAARSPSTWTLPAQASMLTGLYPEQHGATSLGHALSDALTTLPELLAQHGYRTGAVTDSAFVSRHYGLDQGFEWFQEFRAWDLRATLRSAREFLAADDGRPVFLFVQTYRTHMPYRTGADEDRHALETTVRELRRGSAKHGGDGSITLREAGARMQSLYHEGVRALDEQFGAWWRELEAPGRPATYLVFTSDHGEAFYEHGEIGHGGSPWDEKIRIPLLLHGPGLRAATVAHNASLVDLPRTFCALAGIAPPSSFEGADLVALAEQRPAYSFVRIGEQPMVAVIVGAKKLYVPADPERMFAGEVHLATDLVEDPAELQDQRDRSWPGELARAQANAVAHLVRALADPQRVELSEQDRAFLGDIGYGD